MSSKHVLVVGGAGYIGTHTVVALRAAGYKPVIVDNFSNSDRRSYERLCQLLSEKVPLEEVDASDDDATASAIRPYMPLCGVIHFAALKSVPQSIERPLDYYRNNLSSLWNILRHRPTRVVFSSSCTVYGQPKALPVDEQTPIQEASSPYGYTKQVGERMLQDYCQSSSARGVALRYFNPVGAHESAEIGELPLGRPSNLVPALTQAVARGEALEVFGTDYETKDGSCVRDYIHVMDLAEAHVAALRQLEEAAPATYEVFNCGVGRGYSVLEVVAAFENCTKKQVHLRVAPRRAGDIAEIYAQADKAARILGWQAKRSLSEALLHAWHWQQRITQQS